MVFYACQGYGANLLSLPLIARLRISLSADRFEGGLPSNGSNESLQ